MSGKLFLLLEATFFSVLLSFLLGFSVNLEAQPSPIPLPPNTEILPRDNLSPPPEPAQEESVNLSDPSLASPPPIQEKDGREFRTQSDPADLTATPPALPPTSEPLTATDNAQDRSKDPTLELAPSQGTQEKNPSGDLAPPQRNSSSRDNTGDNTGGDPSLQLSENPGIELTLDNMAEALNPGDREITYGNSQYVWKGNELYLRNTDGSMTLVDSFLETQEDDSGNKWLSQDEEGNVLIQVSLRIWATINFAYNSYAILPESEAILQAFGNALNGPALKDYTLLIAGHTDNIGSDTFNLKLSRERASSVAKWLSTKMGISPERLILTAYGFHNPIADNSTPEGQAKNRRVEFVLLPHQNG
ncbi:MAG: OmpA family protein [Deltaproteobacteria bacterium]|jgi:outer membrane protein OmpA-like peptidoglycan-associated protein|nr:OmpA family protein [Deltaproteobacteria bacterium]